MSHYNLALMGFGNVGKALARLLLEKQNELRDNYGLTYTVTGIATGRHGLLINSDGINLERAIDEEYLTSMTASVFPENAFEFIHLCKADVLFENTPVNYQTGQPAVEYLRTALENGMHVITANKGPVVHAYHELTALAESKDRKFYFESAVMDGAPIFSLFRETLPAANLISFRGVLNSTTNVILTRMETGDTFEQAVAYTQEIGLAETDPSGDIDGWDAAVKVAALVTVLMGVPLKPADVDRTGIRGITSEEIAAAQKQDNRWKLLCSARWEGEHIEAQVAPEMVGHGSPFYAIEGSTSIVQFETDTLPQLSITEGDPGPETTAYGLLADFVNAVKE
jgi:homoserine dehydrogenase